MYRIFDSRVNKAPAKIFKFLQRLPTKVVASIIFYFLKATEKTNKANKCSCNEEKVLGSNSKFKTIKKNYLHGNRNVTAKEASLYTCFVTGKEFASGMTDIKELGV